MIITKSYLWNRKNVNDENRKLEILRELLNFIRISLCGFGLLRFESFANAKHNIHHGSAICKWSQNKDCNPQLLVNSNALIFLINEWNIKKQRIHWDSNHRWNYEYPIGKEIPHQHWHFLTAPPTFNKYVLTAPPFFTCLRSRSSSLPRTVGMVTKTVAPIK